MQTNRFTDTGVGLRCQQQPAVRNNIKDLFVGKRLEKIIELMGSRRVSSLHQGCCGGRV